MNARDELRGTLSNTICNASLYTKRAQPYLLGSDMSDVLDKTADSLLAAGYRKPRTITTAEELDALPEGSVILSNGGDDSAQKDGEGYWYLWGGDVGLVSAEIMLPATVLHEATA